MLMLVGWDIPKVDEGEPYIPTPLQVKPGLDDVRAIVKKNLTSNKLDAAFICKELGISRSGLFRLFDGQGGVDTYIRGERIEQVKLAIIKYGNRVKVRDLAKHWHFSDSSHLGRVFRQAFGLSISEARKGYQNPNIFNQKEHH